MIGSLFGWHIASGRRRFRKGWLETGKGQAKSPLMGAIGVYLMGWDGTPRAQCYAIGQDKATATVLFRDAVAMCRADIPGEDPGDILERRIVIDASPVTYSCAANAVLDEDGQGNRAFDKARSRGRIDGMVTIAMGVGAATANEKPKKKSVYASRGIRRL